MRSVFVVLFLANIALFGLGQGWFGQAKSERGREPARLTQQIREEAINVPRLPGVNETGIPPARPGTGSPASDAGDPVGAPGAGGTTASSGSPGSTGSAGASASNAATAATGQSAVLLPATAPSPPTGQTPAQNPVPPSAQPASTALACLEWGSFTDAELPNAQRWSEERLVGARVDLRRVGDRPNWMVVVPAFPNADAAQAAAIQLNRRGVKDLFVIQDPGPYQNAISLGVFRNEESAHRQVDMLQGQGVRNAKVVARPGGTIRSWLVVRGMTADQRQALDEARAAFARQTLTEC